MKTTPTLLTRSECAALRGLAIIAIVLHNYCHFIGSIVKENEYLFSASNNLRLMQVLEHPDSLLPVHLLSYFGHYGVPVFLFLSGFGLVMKYERGEACPNAWTRRLSFVRYHYFKLLRMLIVGFTLFLMVDAVTPGRFHFHWDNVVAQLLLYINVLPTPDKIIWPGIYWFFGLMMELYIVYRLLLYRRHYGWTVALMVLCWLLQALCAPEGETLNRLRYNFVGGMVPFGLGVLWARYERWRKAVPLWGRGVWTAVLIVAVMLLTAMSLSFQSWLWVPVVAVVGSVAFVKSVPAVANRLLVWLGGLSAAMFVAHPIIRKLFIPVAWRGDIYDGLMLYTVVVVAASWVVRQLIARIPQPNNPE